MEKTKIYNLIILDKSGSMHDIRQSAINGFNVTLGSIQAAQKKYADTQEHYLTFVTFCGCGIEYVHDNIKVSETNKITSDDYEPCCVTPLYDAIHSFENEKDHKERRGQHGYCDHDYRRRRKRIG